MSEILILARALHFGSCLLLLSIFAVHLAIEPAVEIDASRARRQARLCQACLVVAAGSGFLWLWEAIAGMSGTSMMASLSPTLFQMVLTQTPPGQVWLVRAAIGIALFILLFFPPRRWLWFIGALLAAAFTASIAWLGHAGAGDDAQRPFMLAADALHLCAAAIWPAGLIPFAFLLRRQLRSGDLSAAHRTVRHFSTLSLITVTLLAATGLVNSWFLVGTLHALVASAYGRLLIIKLILFAITLSLGACNLLIHKPRLATAPAAMPAIARKVWIEIVLF
jgi:putative copper resistance protein D